MDKTYVLSKPSERYPWYIRLGISSMSEQDIAELIELLDSSNVSHVLAGEGLYMADEEMATYIQIRWTR